MLAALAIASGATTLAAQDSSPRFVRAEADTSRVAARARERERIREREAARRKLDFVPAARFAEARARATKAGSQGSPVHVSADKQTSYTMIVRTDTSDVEQHARWDDFVIVQSGRGGVSFGTRAEGRRMLAAGEYRGGRLEGVHHLRLGPGDVVRIPAGVPHAFWPEGGAPFEYMVIKVRHADRPIAPK